MPSPDVQGRRAAGRAQLQLQFNFAVDLESGTHSPQCVVKTSAPTAPGLASSSEKPIHLDVAETDAPARPEQVIVEQAHRLPPGPDMASEALALQSQVRALLHLHGAGRIASEVRVEWNFRLTSCAGRIDHRAKLISLNPRLRDFRRPAPAEAHTLPGKLDCLKQSSLTNAAGDQLERTTPALFGDRANETKSAADKLDCFKQSSLTSAAEENTKRGERLEIMRDEVERTLLHEVAHLLAQFRAGRRHIRPHGVEWRKACADLGIPDEKRCHHLPFPVRERIRRFLYKCPNCEKNFPRVRKFRRAIACLACCRAHNGGEFDPRFRLRLVPLEGHAPSCP